MATMSGSGTEASGSVVHAAGHLHPGMLFVRLFDGLRQMILPVIVALVAQQVWIAIASVVLFVLGLTWAVVRFVTFRYRLTDDELVTTEGVLHRQERRIPVDRIQDLNFESTVMRRVLGLVLVRVETASGQGSEAELDSLSKRDAQRLRDVLHRIRTGGAPVAERPAIRLLHRATASDLVLLGLTSNRVGAILLTFVGIYELSDQFGVSDSVGSVFGGLFQQLSELGSGVVAIVVFGGAFVLLLDGWFLSVIGSLVLYHGFVLGERDGILQRRFGLLTTRAQNLPLRKIQRVLIEAAPLRRLFGAVGVRADSAGSGTREDDGGSGRDVLVPLCPRPMGERLAAHVLAGLDLGRLAWQPVSGKIVARTLGKGVLGGALAVWVGLTWLGPIGWGGVLIPPLALAAGIAMWRNHAFALDDEHLVLRWGVLGRYRAFVPFRKVQGVVLTAGPVDRLVGLSRITVYVAGGSPSSLACLPVEQARELVREVADRAAARRFVW